MRTLTFIAKGRLIWSDVPTPTIKHAHEAIVAPVAATTCDLDRAMIAGHTPFEGPFALGHECVARVVELGSDVTGLAVGDLVSVPWHVSCGTCPLARLAIRPGAPTLPPTPCSVSRSVGSGVACSPSCSSCPGHRQIWCVWPTGSPQPRRRRRRTA
ncbi:alcohol dehydrogenase catalytic domain-containing protein [Streptomyces melanosporofaciens]|uniref:alcohol dehydrogenase catalytic domain-containing protein n=1 Tax=Streptomyces melanosporofaciens TaxID=67327 RepID=UPI001430CA14